MRKASSSTGSLQVTKCPQELRVLGMRSKIFNMRVDGFTYPKLSLNSEPCDLNRRPVFPKIHQIQSRVLALRVRRVKQALDAGFEICLCCVFVIWVKIQELTVLALRTVCFGLGLRVCFRLGFDRCIRLQEQGLWLPQRSLLLASKDLSVCDVPSVYGYTLAPNPKPPNPQTPNP